MNSNAAIKAQLLSVGSANVQKGLLQDFSGTTLPSAGPGAGLESFFIKFGHQRVRLSINEMSPLRVVGDDNKVIVIRDGIEIVRGVLEPAIQHCPEQAYIAISGRCIYDCKFCPVPKMQGEEKSLQRILQMVQDAARANCLRAISLTSGVAKSPELEVKKVVEVVRALRARYDLPIGVSVYPTKTSSEDLYSAGATEVKYNVETLDPEIFRSAVPVFLET